LVRDIFDSPMTREPYTESVTSYMDSYTKFHKDAGTVRGACCQ